MNIKTARAAFVLTGLAVTGAAMAAWHQPGPAILSAVHGEGLCHLPRAQQSQVAMKPDSDLLLLVYGLAQGTKAQ